MKSMRSIKTILRKELQEFVRDRRTLMLALVLGPLAEPPRHHLGVSIDQRNTTRSESVITSSTRRFCWRPAPTSFEAIG